MIELNEGSSLHGSRHIKTIQCFFPSQSTTYDFVFLSSSSPSSFPLNVYCFVLLTDSEPQGRANGTNRGKGTIGEPLTQVGLHVIC